jgi:hypothetical protein
MEQMKYPNRWRPGQSGNSAGRPVGARGRLTDRFVSDVSDAWYQHGAAIVDQMATKEPMRFAELWAQSSKHCRMPTNDNQAFETPRHHRGLASSRLSTPWPHRQGWPRARLNIVSCDCFALGDRAIAPRHRAAPTVPFCLCISSPNCSKGDNFRQHQRPPRKRPR